MTLPPAAFVPVPAPVIDVDLVAAAVRACPLVADLHGGMFGEVATYLPGRRVTGIRATATGLEIHVIGRFPAPALQLAAQIRAAAAPWAGGLPVDVVIEDILLPGELLPGEEAACLEPDPQDPPRPRDTATPPPPASAPATAPPPATTVLVETGSTSNATPAVHVGSEAAVVSVQVPTADDRARVLVEVEVAADDHAAPTVIRVDTAGSDPAEPDTEPDTEPEEPTP